MWPALIAAWPYLAQVGGAIASYLGGRQQAGAEKDVAQLQAAQIEEARGDTMAQLIAQYLQGLQQLQQAQAVTGLQATQLDPVAQQRALNAADIRRQVAEQWRPGQLISGVSTPYLSPAALQAQRDRFNMAVAAASPNLPQTGSAEAFRQQVLQNQADQAQQITNWLKMIGRYRPQPDSVDLYPEMNPSTFPGRTVAINLPSLPGARRQAYFGS